MVTAMALGDTQQPGALYLDGDEPGDQGQEHHFLSVPALPAIDFDFAFQLPPLPAVLHENLGRHHTACAPLPPSPAFPPNSTTGGQGREAASAAFPTVLASTSPGLR